MGKERTTPHGSVLYKNDTLGIAESEHPRNCHFYDEGKEKPIERKGKRALEVGYRDPMFIGREQQISYQDSIIVYDGDDSITMVDKKTITYLDTHE